MSDALLDVVRWGALLDDFAGLVDTYDIADETDDVLDSTEVGVAFDLHQGLDELENLGQTGLELAELAGIASRNEDRLVKRDALLA